MKLEEIKDLFEYKLGKALREGSVLKDGTKIKSKDKRTGDIYKFIVDWCGIDHRDIWEDYIKDKVKEEMSREELEKTIDEGLEEFNSNLIVFDPSEPIDSGIGLGDLVDYEIIKK